MLLKWGWTTKLFTSCLTWGKSSAGVPTSNSPTITCKIDASQSGMQWAAKGRLKVPIIIKFQIFLLKSNRLEWLMDEQASRKCVNIYSVSSVPFCDSSHPREFPWKHKLGFYNFFVIKIIYSPKFAILSPMTRDWEKIGCFRNDPDFLIINGLRSPVVQ